MTGTKKPSWRTRFVLLFRRRSLDPPSEIKIVTPEEFLAMRQREAVEKKSKHGAAHQGRHRR